MPEASVTAAGVGWYGKLPGLGDFASRRLPDAFVQGWDAWLQRGMVHAQEQLGHDAWLARYLVAPIRRFWLAPQLLSDAAWAGLLMPSVDRVGRHFPLTLAVPGPNLAQAIAARAWFAQLDATARRVLDTGYTVEAFEAALAALDAMPAEADDASAELAATLLQPGGEAGTCASVWWCGDADEASRFRCFAALPSAAASVSLLTAPEAGP
jgi:type VI secretion system protein ImpM